MRKVIICLLIVIIICIPKYIFSYYEAYDAFVFSPLISIQKTIFQHVIYLEPFPNALSGSIQEHANFVTDRIASVALISIMSLLTGLSPDKFLTLPLNGIIIVILAYTLGRLFFNKTPLSYFAILYAVIVAYSPGINVLGNTILSIGWGYTLFLTFLVVLFTYFRKNRNHLVSMVLVLIIFFSTYLTYYTTEVWIVLYLLFFSLLGLVLNRCFKKLSIPYSKYNSKMSYLALALVIFFIAFDSIFYSFSSSFEASTALEFFGNYFTHLINKLTGVNLLPHENIPYVWNPPSLVPGIIGYLYLLSIILPAIVYLIVLYAKVGKTGFSSLNLSRNNIFLIIPCIGLTIADVLVYATKGVLDLKPVPLLFPLVALVSLAELKRLLKSGNLIVIVYVGLILTLCFAQFSTTLIDDSKDTLGKHDTYISPITRWISKNIESGVILTDLRTAGHLSSDLIQQKKLAVYAKYFTRDNIGILYNTSCSTNGSVEQLCGSDYIITLEKYKVKPILCFDWFIAKPANYIHDGRLSWLQKIYTTNHGSTYLSI